MGRIQWRHTVQPKSWNATRPARPLVSVTISPTRGRKPLKSFVMYILSHLLCPWSYCSTSGLYLSSPFFSSFGAASCFRPGDYTIPLRGMMYNTQLSTKFVQSAFAAPIYITFKGDRISMFYLNSSHPVSLYSIIIVDLIFSIGIILLFE